MQRIKDKLIENWRYIAAGVLAMIAAIVAGVAVNIRINQDGTVEVTPVVVEYSEEQVPAVIEGDRGELVETTEVNGEEIRTVESIDGGGEFKDIEPEAFTGENGELYADLGEIEWVDASSVEAFKNSVLGRCIIANNYYGSQCVSLARAFWWSYADFDVSTCGTGLAKGMMDCWEQNAGDAFVPIWDWGEIIAGTWVVLNGSWTGHICMALGPVVNGYVACLGENQGGKSCGEGIGGSAANIINVSIKDFIGGYTPIRYIPEPEPEPEPTPDAPDTSIVREA